MLCIKGNKDNISVEFGETQKVPLFKEIENHIKVFARVLCFSPIFTLAAWLSKLYAIKRVTVMATSHQKFSLASHS